MTNPDHAVDETATQPEDDDPIALTGDAVAAPEDAAPLFDQDGEL